jgi:hypothetical protein
MRDSGPARRERSCFVCACSFGASVWRYRCTDCGHSFCSSHCKDLWLESDDVDDGEEDPFTFLKHDPADPSELPFPHGDGASVVSTAAPSTQSTDGGKAGTRLLCIECYAPRRMALLRAELYDNLDDLEQLAASAPADSDGSWRYVPSLASMTPDAVSHGASVVTSAVGRGVGLLSGTVIGGSSMVWGAARNAASTAVSVVPSTETITAAPSTVKRVVTSAPSSLLSAPASVFNYFSAAKSPSTAKERPSHGSNSGVDGGAEEVQAIEQEPESATAKSWEGEDHLEENIRGKQQIVPMLSEREQRQLQADRAAVDQQRQQRRQQCQARVAVLESEMTELQQRLAIAETLRSKAWLTICTPTEADVWYAGYEGVLAWQSQGVLRHLSVRIGTYMGSYVSSWQELVSDVADTGHLTLRLPANTPAGWYCLRVTAAGGTIDATSDYFLLQPSPALTATITPNFSPQPSPTRASSPSSEAASSTSAAVSAAPTTQTPAAAADPLRRLPHTCVHRGHTYTVSWKRKTAGDSDQEVVLLSSDSDGDAGSVGSGDVITDALSKASPPSLSLKGRSRDAEHEAGGQSVRARAAGGSPRERSGCGSSSESEGDIDPGLIENAIFPSGRARFMDLNIGGGGNGCRGSAGGGALHATCSAAAEEKTGPGGANTPPDRPGSHSSAAADGGPVGEDRDDGMREEGQGDISRATLVHSTCSAAMAMKGGAASAGSAHFSQPQQNLEEIRRWTLERELANLERTQLAKPPSSKGESPAAASHPPGSSDKSSGPAPLVLEYSSCFSNWKTVASGLPQVGSHRWTIPVALDQGLYLVRLREVGGSGASRQQTPQYPVQVRDVFEFVSPCPTDTGLRWEVRSTHAIQWRCLGAAAKAELYLEVRDCAHALVESFILDDTCRSTKLRPFRSRRNLTDTGFGCRQMDDAVRERDVDSSRARPPGHRKLGVGYLGQNFRRLVSP